MLRLPYTFAVAAFGGRNWTIFSALLLLVPCILAAIVLKPGVSYNTLLVVGCVAGVGGGNFASSMTNINAFYPDRLKGWALGLNAGGGNLGVPVVQLVGPARPGDRRRRAARGCILAIYIPLIVAGGPGCGAVHGQPARCPQRHRTPCATPQEPHTWIMSFLYIGTFGSFIGFGFAFGQVLQNQFRPTSRPRRPRPRSPSSARCSAR